MGRRILQKSCMYDPDKNAVVRITSNSGDRAGYHLSATSSTGPGYAVYHDANDDTFHINYDTTLGTATQWLITGTQ